ncbi:HAD family phosphatase [Sphingobacterium sp. SRCM116780]|uniref:HAD family hydrolase n=1 Tax=Sphingobacterium sp. SRCM116780 TaxID=2907623 RepID=UPI001F3C781D|nr:HAD family phosphatase [Sphingobacterium sp. SRCM116780]UIR57466.1 HAD family phosphatase [Sphingobacterium sp. SRCM116780]
MEKIKNIILDYGDVIFMIDFLRMEEAFRALGIKNVREYYGHGAQTSLFDDFEQGKISADTFRNGLREITGAHELSDDQINEAWNAMLIGVTEGNHDLLMLLKQKYRLFLLSNNNEIHYQWIMDYLKRTFNLDDNVGFFEKDYYSHLMGMRKPNKEIFEFVLEAHNLEPQETVFIDDSPQHLKTAKELGLQTYLLTKPDTLKNLLYREGLLKD